MHCSRGYSPPRDRTPCLLRLPDWQADSLPLAPPTGMKVKRKVKVKSLSGVRFFATPPTVFCQTPPPMRFSREEYRSWLPFPSPGDLPDPGIEPWSQAPQADSLPRDQTQVSHIAGGFFTSPKKTGVSSLSLLQQIFPTQESNWGLLHCRQILYQLSYWGSLPDL